MGKMIDLSVFQEETIDFKFSEDLIFRCKKPDEELAIKILSYTNINNEEISVEEMMTSFNGLVKNVLNHNVDNKKVEEDFIKSLAFNVKVHILESYTKEMYNKIENNPN